MEPRQQEQLAPIGEIQPAASQYEVGAAQNSLEVAQSGVENHREIGSVRAEAVQAAAAAAPALPTPVLPVNKIFPFSLSKLATNFLHTS